MASWKARWASINQSEKSKWLGKSEIQKPLQKEKRAVQEGESSRVRAEVHTHIMRKQSSPLLQISSAIRRSRRKLV